MADLVLASASPRRLSLLRLADLDPLVRAAHVDESVAQAEDPAAYVARLARTKAAAVPRGDDEVVVAADTAVVVDGESLGKPADAAQAAAMLQRLSGRTHTVSTGVTVVDPQGLVRHAVVTTAVTMTSLDDARIAAYVRTGEPLGKAGGYAIQGRAAAFVSEIAGSWTNVVGLPLVETLRLLRAAGVRPG